MKIPTKSSNIGGLGGARAGAGRKKTATGNRKTGVEESKKEVEKRKLLEETEVKTITSAPKPSEFLKRKQADNTNLNASKIYDKVYEWLFAINCKEVNQDLIEKYAMATARWQQCEEKMSKEGLLAEHPTTGKPIPSPYINIALNYLNTSNRLWNEIYQIAKESADISSLENSTDPMEQLLRGR